MLRKLRLIRRLFLFLVITLGCFAAFEVNRLLYRNNPRRFNDARSATYMRWGRGIAKAFGMKVTVEGSLPTTPYFFVLNHLSYMDIVLAAMTLRNAKFIAKHDMQDWFLLGPMTKRVDTIFVNRESIHAVAEVTTKVDAALKSGFGVGMAPEATTSRGETVLPFHPALFEPAVRLGIPVTYATIRYRTPADELPAWEVVNWWQYHITFQDHVVRLLQVKSFDAHIKFGPTPILGTNRKALAKELHAAVLSQFVPMVTADEQRLDHLPS
jgi:1-acyl-sn-glycerol-3-phosphate acyltransferase